MAITLYPVNPFSPLRPSALVTRSTTCFRSSSAVHHMTFFTPVAMAAGSSGQPVRTSFATAPYISGQG